ncbi:MAG: InlB B-repeat-containing protein, partial [Bifidobacterium asteroides]
MSARAIGILLAVILPASLLAGGLAAADATAGRPSGMATPTTMEYAGKQDPEAPRPDSRQSDAAGSTLTATLPARSSPLSASSPLPSSSPLADAPGSTAGSQPQAQSSQTWTVSFDPAGGSSVGQQAIPDGGQASRPSPDPARDGYLFDGWFQGDIAYDFNQPVTSSITLTARWTSEDTQHWAISPSQGPIAGNTKTTLTPPKPRGIRFSQISAGRGNIAAVASDGNLYCWGSSGHGQQGDGTTIQHAEPVRVLKPEGAPAGFTWVQASAGYMFTLGLGSDGNIYSWGDNENATLGRNIGSKTINGIPADPRPGKVDKPQGAPAGFTWKHVEAGSLHALALGSDGQLYSWGLNDHGYVGNGTTTRQYTPVRVSLPEHAPSGFTWKRMSGWGWHSLALGSDDKLYGWGANGNCELGTGQSTPNRLTPVPVARPEGLSSWGQFQMGDFSSLAIDLDGNAYGWGYNGNGSIGDGSTNNGCSPTKTRPAYPMQSWKQVSVLNGTSLGIDSAGRLYAWGNNTNGQFGDGTTISRNTPVQVAASQNGPSGLTWVQVSAGWDNLSYGLASDGNLYSWGSNINGQLGNGTTNERHTPGRVNLPGAATPTSVLFGQAKATGRITPNPDGTWQASTPKHAPGAVDVTVVWNRNGPQPDAHLQYTFIAPQYQVGFASKDSACPAPTGMPPSQAVTQDGQAERPQPDPKADGCLFDGWFQDNVAYDFTQPVTHDITLTARWTRTDTQHWTISPAQGPEAGGTKVTLTPPARRGVRFSQISLGSSHSAGIGSDGQLYTWGYNSSGQLGDGTTSSRSTPVKIGKPQGAPAGFTWTQVGLGGFHSAAIGSDGSLYTWGSNSSGQLGDGSTTTSRSTPVKIGKPQGAPDGFTWKQVSLGDQHSAAIGSDGNLYTWGSNSSGQLGDGSTTTSRSTPVKVGKPAGAPDGFTWTQVSLGDQHSAAIGSDGNLYTWGYNFNGQLGDGTTSSQSTPTLIQKPAGAPDGFAWTQVSLGFNHSAALGSDGNLYTWGSNYYGQLGDGTQIDKRTPTQVSKPQGAPDGFTWKQASLGRWYSAAIGSDDSLYTWGSNGDGQLGDGTTTSQNRP